MGGIKRRLWLTFRRLEKNLSQTELAERVNVSNRHMSNIELGFRNPSGELAKKIADELDFDMDMFYEERKSA